MSRLFTDRNLLTWEAFASTGPFGFPERPKIIFNCLSDGGRIARFVEDTEGDRADAERRVMELSDRELRELLAESVELS